MRSYSRSEEHVGEWKLTLWADTVEGLFIEAARVIARECGPQKEEPEEWEKIALSSRDTATLLADWCNELLGRSEVERRAYKEVCNLRLDDGRLEAAVRGFPVLEWRSPLKAATYHGLDLTVKEGRYRAVVLFDV